MYENSEAVYVFVFRWKEKIITLSVLYGNRVFIGHFDSVFKQSWSSRLGVGGKAANLLCKKIIVAKSKKVETG
jgi:hypothetical protein